MKIKTALIFVFMFTSLVATFVAVAVNKASQDSPLDQPDTALERAGKAIKTLANSEPPREYLLPDMIVTKPKQIYISNSGSKKTIRFSTTFINQGDGPLEVLGHADTDKGVTYAAQYIKEKGGPGIYQNLGEFVFHPGHTHWHLEDYVYYQLIPLETPDAAPLRQTDKMSFCIWDEDNENLDLENASKDRIYPFTCNRQIQGMSVGWSDTYDAKFDSQEIDITGLSDGRYIFRSIVNPDKKVEEENFDNNTSEVVIEIAGNTLRVVE